MFLFLFSFALQKELGKHRQYSLELIAGATKNFAEDLKVASGATFDVFHCEIEGAPASAKCMRMPEIRSPDVLVELRHRFEAELASLRRFQHERIEKILGVAISDQVDAPYSFVLVFERLEEGSLADWLSAPDGSPSDKPILTAGERVDIALGAVIGISFLHVHDDQAQGGSGAAASGLRKLHRNVKSANIGLARRRCDGPLFSKMLDCGSCEADRGADGAASAAAAAEAGG